MPDRKLTTEELKALVPLRDVAAGVVKLEKRGDEWWGCCPFHKEKTPSFSITPKESGDTFFCFGCGKGGDVLTFIELHEKIDKKQAFDRLHALAHDTAWQEANRQVQENFQPVEVKEKTVYPVSAWPAKEQALMNSAEAIKYLREARGITADTAKALRLGFVQNLNTGKLPDREYIRDKGWILFPRIVGEKIVAIKMRSIVEKFFVQVPNMDPKALFNTEDIDEFSPVFVTEGEYDTAIFKQAGYSAVSIPNANTKVTPEWKEHLMRAPVRYLAGDNDGTVGSEAMRNLHRELGTNTFLILWPDAKDANEFFLKNCHGDIELFKSEVEKLMVVARSTPVEGFTSLLQRLRTTMGTDGQKDPYRLHFKIKQIDDMAYIPAGTICVLYSTYSGTGKSVFINQAMLDEAHRGDVVVVFSPELSGTNYLALVAAQTLTERKINRSLTVTQADYQDTATKLDVPTENGGDFQFYVGHSLPDGDPLDFIENTVKVTGATRFVIDTLHRVCVPQNRQSMTECEGAMAKRLENIAKKYGCIFILIGQSNKEAEDLKEKRRDSKGVLRGSREIWDVAHAIYLLHRKKKPEDAVDKTDLLDETCEVSMEKNRTAGPGTQVVWLQYVRVNSRFYLQEHQNSGTMVPAGSALGQEQFF